MFTVILITAAFGSLAPTIIIRQRSVTTVNRREVHGQATVVFTTNANSVAGSAVVTDGNGEVVAEFAKVVPVQ